MFAEKGNIGKAKFKVNIKHSVFLLLFIPSKLCKMLTIWFNNVVLIINNSFNHLRLREHSDKG